MKGLLPAKEREKEMEGAGLRLAFKNGAFLKDTIPDLCVELLECSLIWPQALMGTSSD